MVTYYHAFDMYNGEDEIFFDHDEAKEWAAKKLESAHKFTCVERKIFFSPQEVVCLCEKSAGKKECAAHSYQRTVRDHSITECPLKAHIDAVRRVRPYGKTEKKYF